MDVLFLISIACFFALFVAALAIARHVRMAALHSPEPDKSIHQISAPARDRAQLSTAPHTEQDLHTLTQHKQPDWRFLVSEERRTAASVTPLSRKPPTAAHRHRPDWAYFDTDLGDLSDPYEPPIPRAATGTHNNRRP